MPSKNGADVFCVSKSHDVRVVASESGSTPGGGGTGMKRFAGGVPPDPRAPLAVGCGACARRCAAVATDASAAPGLGPPSETVYESVSARGMSGIAAVRKMPAPCESARGAAVSSVANVPPYVPKILFSKSVIRPGPNPCEMPAETITYGPRFCWLFAPVYCAFASNSVALRGKTPSSVMPARWIGRFGNCEPTIVVDGPSPRRPLAAVNFATLSV